MAVYITDPFRRKVVTVLVVLALLLMGLTGVLASAAVWNFLNPAAGEPAYWALAIASLLAVDFASLFAFIIPIVAAAVPVAITAVSYRFNVNQGRGATAVVKTSELSAAGKAIALILLIGGVLNMAAMLVLNSFASSAAIVIPPAEVEAMATLVMVSLAFQATYFVQLMGLRPEG